MPDNNTIPEKRKTRTDEVNDIIEKMPTGFGRWVTLIVLFIFILMILSGWIIKYPDVVKGQITINAMSSPLKLVAQTSGKLKLGDFKSKDKVKEGNYIAVIQNPANTKDVQRLDSLIQIFNSNDSAFAIYQYFFPKKLVLGELNVNYYAFLSALYNMIDYQEKNVFEKQEIILRKLASNQEELLQENYDEKKIRKRTMQLQRKSYYRDSLLHKQKVLADAELEKSKMVRLSAIESYKVIDEEITSNLYKIEETRNKLQQLQIQKSEKEKELKLELLNSYYELREGISSWEQKYVLKSPIDGRVEFLQFWRQNQFVKAGEAIFTIVPKENKIVGQVLLPEHGSGKVKPGQQAIIKLDNYPYIEYGSINGIVKSISLVTNSQQVNTGKGVQQSGTYLVKVALPEGLKTNYGSTLDFKFEIKGTAEIITKDRRLIERMFDNLKYIVSDKNDNSNKKIPHGNSRS